MVFPEEGYNKPIAIVGYNNAGKTNLLNAILYGITERYVNKNTFSIDDFHNRDYNNIPYIVAGIKSSSETKSNGKTADLTGYHFLNIKLDGEEIESANIDSYTTFEKETKLYTSFGAAKLYKIFYINFHEIKKEISTKKNKLGKFDFFFS
ncbi:AAA family ATPase [Halobacillus mangrovi]|uniref:AAA family ATPase n=1 Tax=Halobacillus mangrovi TaxID=402384 RepID=UPI003D980A65